MCKIVFAKPTEVMNVGKRSDVVDMTSHKRCPRYAKEIKRKQQRLDLIKKQAHIRASVFRPVLASNEIEELLKAADASVELKPTAPGMKPLREGAECDIPNSGTPPKKGHWNATQNKCI